MEDQNNNLICKKCGGKVFHNKGISKKTGNPYENKKCANCKDVIWLSSEPKKKQRMAEEENEQYQNLMKASRHIARMLKLVAFKVGYTERDLNDDLVALEEGKMTQIKVAPEVDQF